MSMKDTKEAAQRELIRLTAANLREAYCDISIKAGSGFIDVQGNFNLGAELMIIDTFISDIMEDGDLDFADVIYLIRAVHSIGKERVK